MQRFDPARASAVTYADRVLTSNVTDLVRRSDAQRRNRHRERSLEDLPRELFPRTAGAQRQSDLRHDVGIVLSHLPDADRAIARSLADHNVAEVTRRTGLSRQSVRSARARVRRQFEKCGVAA